MPAAVPISILDVQPPQFLPQVVAVAEEFGYARYWTTEHYSARQSASPAVVAALAAGLTDRVRVGTAGVLLRMCAAAKVAADFAALELFYPGRIDLGIAGATAGASVSNLFATDVRIADDAMFVDRLQRLVDWVRHKPHVGIGPATDGVPQLWLCGTSRKSAEVAARFGMRFAFHQYLGKNVDARDVADAYRDAFVPCDDQQGPHFAIAAYGACAPAAVRARTEWNGYFHDSEQSPTFVGTPSECARQLSDLVGAAAADEIVVDCFARTIDARLDGLACLARAWQSTGHASVGS